MRIVLSHASEFQKGEGHDVARVLKRLGHEVYEVNVATRSDEGVVRGFPPDATLDDVLNAAGCSDLFLYVEPLGLVPSGLESSSVATAAVISDVHRDLKKRVSLAAFFDHVFLYQRNYLRHFAFHPPGGVHWWPWSCDSEVYRDSGLTRDIDVAFVGQLHPGTMRERVMTELRSKHSVNELRWYDRDEIPRLYGRSKIVVNMPLADDLNLRFFEALSCGAMLLTAARDNGQDELFIEGKHFISFSDEQDLLQKVDYYVANDAERFEIAKAGCEEVRRGKTLEDRLQILLQAVTEESGGAPVRGMSEKKVIAAYARLYERNGQVEAILRLAARLSGTSRVALVVLAAKSLARRAFRAW